jgi:hypothetical protein
MGFRLYGGRARRKAGDCTAVMQVAMAALGSNDGDVIENGKQT